VRQSPDNSEDNTNIISVRIDCSIRDSAILGHPKSLCGAQIDHLSLTFDKSPRNSVVDDRGVRMPTPTELLQGTLDLLILQTLATGPMHGWGVAQRIQQLSKDVLQI
jgi:hypothetical protein